MRILDYYIKDLAPDYQRHMIGGVMDLVNKYHDDYVYERGFLIESLKGDKNKIKNLHEMVYWNYENLNRYMICHKRYPLFDTSDLKSCINRRDELLEWLTEEECMKKYGFPKFDDYKPLINENDYQTVISFYTDSKDILYALQKKITPNNSFEGGLTKNYFEYINWELLKLGLKPLFDNPDDYDFCSKKRDELLNFLPIDECLKYFNLNKGESIEKAEPMCFKIHNYIHYIYGEDAFGSSWKYNIGWRVRYLLDGEMAMEDNLRYIKEIKNISEGNLFSDNPDYESSIKFLKENLILVPLKEIYR